jgi:homocysteine S-methyltransferase
VLPGAPPRALPDFLADVKRKTVVLVELDPPKTTDIQKMIRGARALKAAGADAVTIGDSPLAALRMNSMIAGAILQREAEVTAICHLACRDRNLIGTQSLLLGADALGVRAVLAITGDPAKVGDHPEATSVYDLNSFRLIELLAKLNRGQTHVGQSVGRPTAFHIGVAFNPNVRNLDVEVKRLRKKIACGANFVLTQAVFDADTMARACAAVKDLGVPVFAGVFPLVSSRHAEFLHNEFPGISVCEEVRKRMAAAGTDKARAAAEGMAIARELADAFRTCADGLYLIPPFNRYQSAVELLHHIKARAAV